MNDRSPGPDRAAPPAASAHALPGHALVLGTFPPIAGAESAASVAAVGALLSGGYRVETVSLSGHGDAHLALDFAKTYALRRFRAALAKGPVADCIVLVPGAIRMRRPNTAARLLALAAQFYTLCWLAFWCRRFLVVHGRGADRAGGWRPAARIVGPLLKRLGSKAPSAPERPPALAAHLLAAAWGDGREGRLAASMATLLGDGAFEGTAATLADAAQGPSPTTRSRALAAALAPCPRWSQPGAPVEAWMSQLRATRGALPNLSAKSGHGLGGADRSLPAGDAASLLRRWAQAELESDAALAGMADTLRSAGHAPLSAAEAAMLARESAPQRAWAALAGADALRAPLQPPPAADTPLLEALGEALASIAARAAECRPARDTQRSGSPLPSSLSAPVGPDGGTARLTGLGLATALAAALPGGMPQPGKPIPPPLRRLLNTLTAHPHTGPSRQLPPLHLPATSTATSTTSIATGEDGTAPHLRLVGHARRDMGLGANLAMTAEALAAAGIASLPLSADNGLEPLAGAPRPATPRRTLRRAATILHLNADRLPPALLHRRLASAESEPAFNIGFLLWELDRLPEAHSLAVEMLDEIWAPTPFVAEAYRPAAERAGTALKVVGKAVLNGPVAPLGRAALGLPEGAFLFLTSFDFHSSVERKNPLALVRAFGDAFPKGAPGARDMALAIKTTEILRGHWGDPDGQWPAIEAAAAADPRIHLLSGRMEAPAYRALLKSADVYVSTHRAEGFGYGPAEAMLRERPVIATDWSGTTAFCSPRTSFPVPCRMVPVRPGETILPVPGACWAEIDHDALVDTLRHAAADTAARRTRALAGATLMRDTYGLEAHATRLAARLDALGILLPETGPSSRQPPAGEPAPRPRRSAA